MASTIWKGHISFGLISIPVKLVRAARAERVRLNQVYRAPAPKPEPADRAEVIELAMPPARAGAKAPEPEPVKERRRNAPVPEVPPPRPEPRDDRPVERVRQAAVTSGEDRPIAPRELEKGYEYEPDRWVVLGRDEIKSIAPETSRVMEITEFVRFAEIDPVYLESSYYVIPERAGEKAYAVLYQALRETNFAAVAQIAMHGREHIVILRPGRSGLVAHTMFFENEVRKEEEHRADAGLASQREVDLAKTLVESLAGTFQPEKYKDSYREKLEALIAAKVQGRDVAGIQAPPPAKAPVLDLVDALQKSLEAARKPPASAAPAEPEPKKRTPRRSGRAS